ncbi:MAG TPA: NADP-dependent oxidoreductase [Spongiibacteraceae bacterium]|nr:NADP-dependent oxidoreductase [Spongiibacteraceae bacterium]
MQATNRQWLLASRPQGMVGIENFTLREVARPSPNLAAGEILVRNLMLSFEPAMRGWLDDVPSYFPPVQIGDPMRSSAMAEVVSSTNPQYPVGSLVMGMFGWQEYALGNCAGDMMPPVPIPAGTPLSIPLGSMGGSSLTAYFGLLDVGQPQPGEIVVVSGAAGAVGCVVAQIARIKGCRVIGIAGGSEKCAWLKTDCGLDEVIDYKTEDVAQRLAELCPRSIDVFFDNVGGSTLEAAIEQIAEHGRIVLCGAISTYNDAESQPGPRNLMNLIIRRVRMQGFITVDYLDRMGEAQAALMEWVFGGQIKYREDIQHGFENIPKTFLRLFSGDNQGKQLLQIGAPTAA